MEGDQENGWLEVTPGSRWRFGAGELKETNRGVFDELLVDDWLHIENLDRNVWWLRLGDARIFIQVSEDGSANALSIQRGEYGPQLPALDSDAIKKE